MRSQRTQRTTQHFDITCSKFFEFEAELQTNPHLKKSRILSKKRTLTIPNLTKSETRPRNANSEDEGIHGYSNQPMICVEHDVFECRDVCVHIQATRAPDGNFLIVEYKIRAYESAPN